MCSPELAAHSIVFAQLEAQPLHMCTYTPWSCCKFIHLFVVCFALLCARGGGSCNRNSHSAEAIAFYSSVPSLEQLPPIGP